MANKIENATNNSSINLVDNEIVCDSLIENLNDLLKNIAAGQYIRVSSLVLEMVQKLMNLKKGIRNDRKSLEDQLEDLRRLNNELAEKAFGAPEDSEDNND